jgi:hypothetical protein
MQFEQRPSSVASKPVHRIWHAVSGVLKGTSWLSSQLPCDVCSIDRQLQSSDVGLEGGARGSCSWRVGPEVYMDLVEVLDSTREGQGDDRVAEGVDAPPCRDGAPVVEEGEEMY